MFVIKTAVLIFYLLNVKRSIYHSFFKLAILPYLLSALYFVVLKNRTETDVVFYCLVGLLTFVCLFLYVWPVHLSFYFRFVIAILLCGLFNRNIYLLLLFNTSTVVASVVSQSLNLVFSFRVNGRFTCPLNGEDRRFTSGYRSLFYVLSFVGEIAMHAVISRTLLHYVDPYWTWFFTGIIILPYSFFCLKVIFGNNSRIKNETLL